jgi:hypothetical protein
MTLSDQELTALQNLARKKAGEEVDWINISAGRALTELGLAQRNRGGWEITPQGVALVEGQNRKLTLVEPDNLIDLPPPHSSNDSL